MLTLPHGIISVFDVSLLAADGSAIQANPTLASGDVKLAKDGGTLTNLGTLPSVAPASGQVVKVTLSAAETTCSRGSVIFVDAAGAEWADLQVPFQTVPKEVLGIQVQGTAQAGGASTITLASGTVTTDDDYVNAQIQIINGTGAGQVRTISDTVASTQVATVSAAWDTNPDSTSVYNIFFAGVSAEYPSVNVEQIDGSAAAALTLKDNLSLSPLGTASGTPTTTNIPSDLTADGTTDYVDRWLFFLDGDNAGQGRKITAYDGAGTFTTEAFDSAAAADDTFRVV